MAERRMFAKTITEDDNFMSLSASAQALYLHLSMAADDDGFCNKISISMFRAHASISDLEALLEKRYIYQFDNGVIVIKHWRMCNALRKDRYTPTVFQEELKMLNIKDNGAYTMANQGRLPDGCQMVATCLPQDSIGKDSIGKDSMEEKPKRERYVKPTLEEVKAYITEKGYNVNAENWFNYYESNGWKVGKNSMKNWQACIAQWNARENKSAPKKKSKAGFEARDYDYKELEKKIWG